MSHIFSKPVWFIGGPEDHISLFESVEDYEFYQLRMGLQSLCQNTIIYPLKPNAGMNGQYVKHESPHAKEFYDEACTSFRSLSTEACKKCDQVLSKIADFFFIGESINELQGIDYSLFPYDSSISEGQFIRYLCPYVKLYKFGFPIYVEGDAIAVLFTGQFSVKHSLDKPFRVSNRSHVFSLFSKHVTSSKSPIEQKPGFVHSFESENDLMSFVYKSLLPIVYDFASQAEHNLSKRRVLQLMNTLKKQIEKMEEQVMNCYLHLDTSLGCDIISQKDFWRIVRNNIQPYLAQIGVKYLLFFIDEDYSKKHIFQRTVGRQICPQEETEKKTIFDFSLANEICFHEGNNTYYSYRVGIDYPSSVQDIATCIFAPPEQLNSSMDVLVNFEKLQPFSLLICYSENSPIINSKILRQNILEQLDLFFTKVGQEMAYFCIWMSEHITKTVLRIYRHEIAHQCTVLEQNNWFLDAQRLRELDDNKLRHIADDQLQCLCELDFMTQNIDVVTGTIKKGVNFECREIDVSTELINKLISLYRAEKEKKTLWFTLHTNNSNRYINSNLELLDIVIFNLMSNAIKYSYPGTKITIGIEETGNYIRPNKISITDYGIGVDADYQNQVFQMYFRGSSTTHVEGSGIGLYVSYTVAEIMNASLSWTSKKISNYNIPFLMRFFNLPQGQQTLPSEELSSLQEEFIRIKKGQLLSRVFNEEFLNNIENWNPEKILGEIMKPTFEVTFTLEL